MVERVRAVDKGTGPLPGLSLRRTVDGKAVLRVHHTADPDKRSEEWRRRERAKFTSESIFKQEVDIDYEAKDGALVYPEFDESIHVIAPSAIPAKMTRYMSIDPHPRTPHAMLWVGIDIWSDWYVYREFWPSVVYGRAQQLKDTDLENSYTIKEYCGLIALIEGNWLEYQNEQKDDEYAIYRRSKAGDRLEDGRIANKPGENIVYRFMDQAGKAFRASGEGEQLETYARRYDRYGIQCVDPRKSHEAGEDAIRELLKPRRHDVHGQWPKVHISSDCPETILELRKLRYPKQSRFQPERELKQQAVEARRHLVDNFRYLATGEIRWIPSLAS